MTESRMTDTGEPALERRLAEASRAPTVGKAGHGRGRPSSWLLIGAVIAAFAAGGAAIVLHVWPLLWACVAVVVLAVPAGKAMRIMDDTVTWHDPLPEGQGGGQQEHGGAPPPASSSQLSPPYQQVTSAPLPPSTSSSSAASSSSPDDSESGHGRRNMLAAVPVAVATGAAVVAGWLIRRRAR
jgi:hypothetical protein